MPQDKTTKVSHATVRRPSTAGQISGESQDISYQALRPLGDLHFTGNALTTDPLCGQYPSGADTGLCAPFETLMGRLLDFINTFADPNTISSNTFRFSDWPGRRLIISQPLMAPGWDMAATAAGAHDSDYQAAAANLAPFADRIIAIRVGWEMNQAGGYPWSIGGSGTNQSAANYVLCFQRFANYLREAMPGVLIDWCYNYGSPDPTPWYPGDGYCDVVGMDCYLNSAFWPDSFGTTFEQAFGLRFLDGFAAAHGKFISIPEWSSNYNTGTWITAMAAWMKRPRANRLLYQSYWNSNDSFAGALSGYPVNQAAYLAAFGDPGNIYPGSP